jgi:hypothetical protein
VKRPRPHSGPLFAGRATTLIARDYLKLRPGRRVLSGNILLATTNIRSRYQTRLSMKPAVTRKWSSFAGFPSRAIANVIAPIIGQAWVAYVPYGRVVGLSKFARVVDAYAERLQIQERMTSEIASAVQEVLQRQGVGVVIKAIHHCLERGVQKVGAEMVTSCMHGCFRDSARRGKNSWL